jgi:hypothetical protein
MNTFWLSLLVVLIIVSAALPDEIAIILGFIDIGFQAVKVWVRSLPLRILLWLRLKWDGSWFAWRLWVIRQQAKHNKNNTKEGNE